MLWRAGQARLAREGRERLAELYVAVRDGYLAGTVAAGKAKWSGGGDHTPSYARPEPGQQPLRSPAGRDATLARLGAMFPGMVKRTDS